MLIVFTSLPFLRGGRTQIARHTLDVFEGGGPGKCQRAFIFLTAFYLQDFILVGPLTLYGISFIFLKNTAVEKNNRIQIKISNGPQKDLERTFMGSP